MYMQMLGRGMRVFDGKTDMILLDHAGCVYEHGFVHEITEWELDETKQTENPKEKKRKGKNSKPITCPECSHVYTGQLKCPQCGNLPEMKQFGKDVEYIDGQLGEVCFKSKAAKPEKFTKEEKSNFYGMMLHYVRQKGFKPGFIYHKYKEKFGVAPAKMGNVAPILPDADFMSYLTYLRIKQANRKER
jgi:hypothetical protein